MTEVMNRLSRKGLLAGFCCLALSPGLIVAQTSDPVPPETQLVSVSGAPAATEYFFSADTSGQDLTVTLTDLQVPQALASATVVITQGGAIVGDANSPGYATLAPPATSATMGVKNPSGQYTVRVFGAPGAAGVGTFTVCVAKASSPSSCIQGDSVSGNISATGATPNPTLTTVSESFHVTNGGAYTVTFADEAFPTTLAIAPSIAIFQGSQIIQLNIGSGSNVNLSPGDYALLAYAEADATSKGGLWGLKITGAGGTVLDKAYPVGGLTPATTYQNSGPAASMTLSVIDYAFPAALSAVKGLVTAGSQVLANVTGAGSTALNAPAASNLQIWSFATAGSDAGTFEVDLTAGGAPLAQHVDAVSLGNSQAYAFVAPLTSAGALQAVLTDFDFPNALTSLRFAVAQSGAILQQSTMPTTLNVNVGVGGVVLLVNASPPTSGNGLFDVSLASGSTLLFDKTQALGTSNAFFAQTNTFGSALNYDVSLTDLKFPAQFQNLALVVSSGGNVLGKVIGDGTFSIQAPPGNYQITFVATPAAGQQYGLYALQVVPTAPTVTLAASPMSVGSGDTTTLSWTTTAADSCTASGGSWSGTKATGSGSEAVAVTATTTYTLTCMGPGGSNAGTVTVTALAPPSSSHGGGGASDVRFLGLLFLVALGSVRRKSVRHVA